MEHIKSYLSSDSVVVQPYGWLEMYVSKCYELATSLFPLSVLTSWFWRKHRYVVLKVFNNNFFDKPPAEHELRLSRHIATANPHPGRQYVRTAMESFEVEGHLGTHLCLVFEPMREPIWLLQRRMPGGRFPSDILKHIVEFVLSGLDYLHSECHVIHTGDFRRILAVGW
jgi:serine/threonine protein kinase